MIHEFKQIIENACNIDTIMSVSTLPAGGRITNVEMFQQTWPSTALGFPGCGGDAMTTAFTTVVHVSHNGAIGVSSIDGTEVKVNEYYVVFFDGRCAYTIFQPTERFHSDLIKHQMADCEKAKTLY